MVTLTISYVTCPVEKFVICTAPTSNIQMRFDVRNLRTLLQVYKRAVFLRKLQRVINTLVEIRKEVMLFFLLA